MKSKVATYYILRVCTAKYAKSYTCVCSVLERSAHKEMMELVDAMTKDHYSTIIDHLGRIRYADGLTNKKFRRLLSDTLGVKKHDKRLVLLANKVRQAKWEGDKRRGWHHIESKNNLKNLQKLP